MVTESCRLICDSPLSPQATSVNEQSLLQASSLGISPGKAEEFYWDAED